jgi:hypothetical protein
MFLTDWIKQLGPCSIIRSIECTNEIIKFIDNIKQDKAIVVSVNLNHEAICKILFFFFSFLKLNIVLSYAKRPITFVFGEIKDSP